MRYYIKIMLINSFVHFPLRQEIEKKKFFPFLSCSFTEKIAEEIFFHFPNKLNNKEQRVRLTWY